MGIVLTDDERAKFAAYQAEQNTPAESAGTKTDDKSDVPMIVAYTHYVDQNGVTQQKAHGPMPVSEWAAYERKHGM